MMGRAIPRRVTDADCLRAAERALAAHLATVPATREQVEAILADLEAREEGLRAEATARREAPVPEAVWFAGGHNPGAWTHAQLTAAGALDAAADRLALQAAAWRSVDVQVTWIQVRVELEARVAFYAARVNRPATPDQRAE